MFWSGDFGGVRLSVYVDSDAVRLYLAGKASGWHAGVFWLTVTPGGVNERVTQFKN